MTAVALRAANRRWPLSERGERCLWALRVDRMLKRLLPASLNAIRAAATSANIGDVRGHLGWALSRGRLTVNGKLAEHRVTPR